MSSPRSRHDLEPRAEDERRAPRRQEQQPARHPVRSALMRLKRAIDDRESRAVLRDYGMRA